MSASQRPVDPRSPLVFDVRALGRRAGAMTTVATIRAGVTPASACLAQWRRMSRIQ